MLINLLLKRVETVWPRPLKEDIIILGLPAFISQQSEVFLCRWLHNVAVLLCVSHTSLMHSLHVMCSSLKSLEMQQVMISFYVLALRLLLQTFSFLSICSLLLLLNSKETR